MTEESRVRNVITSGSAGSVIQARTVHRVFFQSNACPPPVPRQLPASSRQLVGRADALDALDRVLIAAAGGICVVDGTAGVGKTTLAVSWAHRAQSHFADGTLFANLRGYDSGHPLEASSVLVSFLRAFGIAEADVPAGVEAQAGLYRSLLSGKRVLVVLDNASSAEQVRPLLPGASGCAALVTSRQALTGLAVTEGAQSVGLGLFSDSEAKELLRAVMGEDRVHREDVAVSRLIGLCARLPLALRVAATRVAAQRWSAVADLVAEIEGGSRLDALSRGGDVRTSVHTVFDWSYTRLDSASAEVFRRLGLHPGPEFSLAAVAAFGGIDLAAAARCLDVLVDANVVDAVAHRRYRVHDLLHVYAAQRVAADEPPRRRDQAARAGLAWYAGTGLVADRLVFPAHPQLTVNLEGPEPLPLVDRAAAWEWLTTEFHTLRSALRQASVHDLHEVAVGLASAMRFLVFKARALWPIRLEAESTGLHAARLLGDLHAAMTFLRRRADTHQMLGQWADSDADLGECVVLATRTGDSLLLGSALCGVGRDRKLQGRLVEAHECYLRALPLVRGSGHVEAVVESNLSQISAAASRHADALKHADRELELRAGGDDPAGEGYALHDMARAHQGLANHRAAVEFGERAIVLFRTAVATERYLANALETVARSYRHLGAESQASQCLVEAAQIRAELGESETQGRIGAA